MRNSWEWGCGNYAHGNGSRRGKGRSRPGNYPGTTEGNPRDEEHQGGEKGGARDSHCLIFRLAGKAGLQGEHIAYVLNCVGKEASPCQRLRTLIIGSDSEPAVASVVLEQVG